jgi:hypothetical protein
MAFSQANLFHVMSKLAEEATTKKRRGGLWSAAAHARAHRHRPLVF